MKRTILFFTALVIVAYFIIISGSGCAQVGFPTGGAKDTLAPVLTRASPENEKTNFTGNKVTLVFDEYIDLKDIQANLLVSPLPKLNPVISSNLKTINIKFRDTLKPNTTYSLNFGNAIADVHENNVLRNFTYTFSTGNTIDSLKIAGKVLLAETGKADTTIFVSAYKEAPDTAATSSRPDYIARLSGDGNFKFSHLPAANFKIYALKDGDGNKFYNSKSETFAFSDSYINTAAPVTPVLLFAYAEQKAPDNKPPASKKPQEKKLKYTSSISARSQDLLQPLQIIFNNGLKKFDSTKLILSDSNYKPIPNFKPVLDSSRTTVSMNVNWQPETDYIFILSKDLAVDSADHVFDHTDTIRFTTKKTTDYGTILLRFKNIDLAKHPVIQFLQADAVKFSFPVTSSEWSNKRFAPGEYEVRILYDTNNNGIWDPGNYKNKLQPEHVISLPQKLAIKADWDNEREIQL